MQLPEKAILAIVRPLDGVQNPGLLFQVIIDPKKVNGEFIRLGDYGGDELTGWKRWENIDIVHILGTLGEDGKTVTPYESS